jgi:FkbM family methyltransferase
MSNDLLRPLKRKLLDVLVPAVRAYVRYAPTPLAKELLATLLVPWEHSRRSRPFIARTRFDARMGGNINDIIQAFIYMFGVWEPNLTAFVRRRLRPGDVFVDVGANVGYFSLLASTLVDSGGVVAIEASPRIFDALERNLRLNDARNVRAVNVAVAAEPGTLPIYSGPSWNIGATTTVKMPPMRLLGGDEYDYRQETSVPAFRLDDILTDDEIERARLVKIDVEGAEWSVVRGIDRLLARARPDLEFVVEVIPRSLALQDKRAEDVLDVFLDAGYRMYLIENNYRLRPHFDPRLIRRPVRCRRLSSEETFKHVDVVLSRCDAETL